MMETPDNGVSRDSASTIAREVAEWMDKPAWILQDPREGWHTRYHVACMDYSELDEHYNTGNVVAVVLPTGREFTRLNYTWGGVDSVPRTRQHSN